MHHPKNRGYDAAVCTGFYRATGNYVFFSDADLQFALDEVGKFACRNLWLHDQGSAGHYHSGQDTQTGVMKVILKAFKELPLRIW